MLRTKVSAEIWRNVIAFNRVDALCTDPTVCGGDLSCYWQSTPPGGQPPAPDVIAPGILEDDCVVDLRNNTFHRNLGGSRPDHGGAFHAMAGLFGGSRIKNNIFSRDAAFELYLDGISTGFTPDFNCFDSATPCGGTCNLGASNVFGDPMFVDASRCDGGFELAPGSPCIDAGDCDDAIPPVGGPCVDVGALESIRLQTSR